MRYESLTTNGLCSALCWLLPISFAGCGADEPSRETAIAQLAVEYRQAKTEAERRDVCIKAIESGAIRVGGPIRVFDEVFGTDLRHRLPPERADNPMGEYSLWLAEQPKHKGDIVTKWGDRIQVQSPLVGWYFGVEYDRGGFVREYELTNCHIKTPLWEKSEQEKARLAAEYATEYRQARTEAERLKVCIRVMDTGERYFLKNTAVFDKIFGTRIPPHPKPGGPEERPAKFRIWLADPPEQKKLATENGVLKQERKVGWYLFIGYTGSGETAAYWLSNCPNESPRISDWVVPLEQSRELPRR